MASPLTLTLPEMRPHGWSSASLDEGASLEDNRSCALALQNEDFDGKFPGPSADDAWMRMRTPSPESFHYAYTGRAPPLPPQTLLGFSPNDCHQCSFESERKVFSALAGVKGNQHEADDETVAGSSTRRSSTMSTIPTFSDSDNESFEFDQCGVCVAEPPASDAADVIVGHAPSKGSIGHPYTCAAACKYVKKARGCKDGANCTRCHLCPPGQSSRKPSALPISLLERLDFGDA